MAAFACHCLSAFRSSRSRRRAPLAVSSQSTVPGCGAGGTAAWFDSCGNNCEQVKGSDVPCTPWPKSRLDPFVTRLRALQGAARACHTGLAHRCSVPMSPCSLCVTQSSPTSGQGPVIQCEIRTTWYALCHPKPREGSTEQATRQTRLRTGSAPCFQSQQTRKGK